DVRELRMVSQLQVLLGHVALVEDQRCLMQVQLMQDLQELWPSFLEGDDIDLIAGIDMGEQGHLGLGRGRQGPAHLAQIMALGLAVAPLRKLGAAVVGGDEGEEVGGVEGDDLRLADLGQHLLDQCGQDGLGRLLDREAVHGGPEVLRGHGLARHAGQPRQAGALVPLGEASLGADLDGAVDSRQHHVGADGGARAGGGAVTVDLLPDTELLAERPQSSDGSEAVGADGGRLSLPALGGDQVFERAEVDLLDPTGLAIDAASLGSVEVAAAFDGLDLKVHLLGATLARQSWLVKLQWPQPGAAWRVQLGATPGIGQDVPTSDPSQFSARPAVADQAIVRPASPKVPLGRAPLPAEPTAVARRSRSGPSQLTGARSSIQLCGNCGERMSERIRVHSETRSLLEPAHPGIDGVTLRRLPPLIDGQMSDMEAVGSFSGTFGASTPGCAAPPRSPLRAPSG